MPFPFIPVAIAALVVGVGVAIAGGGKGCKVLATPQALDAWAKANQNMEPKNFLMMGLWLRGPDGKSKPGDLTAGSIAFMEDICDDPPAETVIIDFQALLGTELDFLKEQGIEGEFPDENIALCIRMKPTPQFYLTGGDQPEELERALGNIRAFFAGEIDGQPIQMPGATYTKGESLKTTLVK